MYLDMSDDKTSKSYGICALKTMESTLPNET